jgi:hypothetical protein
MNVEATWDKKLGFLTTVVEDQTGQSIFEFMIMLPILVALFMILARMNSAIQVSIVNQKYARSQALFLAFNSPFYPRLEQKMVLASSKNNQMIMGVSENAAPVDGSDYVPRAATQPITRNKGARASDAPKEEPRLRANVRIRNTVTLCTPLVVLNTGQPILPLSGKVPTVVGKTALVEGVKLDNFCGSTQKYEQ